MQLFSLNDAECPDVRIRNGLVFFHELILRPDLKKGLHYQDGSDIFANVIDYTTPAAGDFFEAHRKFIDLQIMVTGTEKVEYTPIHGLDIQTDYRADDDYLLFHAPDAGQIVQTVILSPDHATVFYPDDAHRPGLVHNGAQTIRKIVVKIPV